MRKRRLHKIEFVHIVGMSESERLKVTALNFVSPSRLSPFSKIPIVIQSLEGEERVWGNIN